METFLRNLAGQAIGYFVIAGCLYWLSRSWGAARFDRRKIERRARANWRQVRHESKHSLVALVTGSLTALLLLMLAEEGYTKVGLADPIPGAGTIALTVIGLVLFNDLWFYGCHRLLHRPWLFQHVHSVHHRSVDTTPFASYSFHLIEALLLGGWVIPAALFLPLPIPVLVATSVIGTANNFMAHLGFEFLPRWILRVPILRWMNTATFHSLHHSTSRGNFGLFTRIWDRLLGTEIDEYEERFRSRP